VLNKRLCDYSLRRYGPFFLLFFNGLSFHLSAAFASHLLGFRMSWGSTSKEVEDTDFFEEVRPLAMGERKASGHARVHACVLPVFGVCGSNACIILMSQWQLTPSLMHITSRFPCCSKKLECCMG
jgi:hypothetical protein